MVLGLGQRPKGRCGPPRSVSRPRSRRVVVRGLGLYSAYSWTTTTSNHALPRGQVLRSGDGCDLAARRLAGDQDPRPDMGGRPDDSRGITAMFGLGVWSFHAMVEFSPLRQVARLGPAAIERQ